MVSGLPHSLSSTVLGVGLKRGILGGYQALSSSLTSLSALLELADGGELKGDLLPLAESKDEPGTLAELDQAVGGGKMLLSIASARSYCSDLKLFAFFPDQDIWL